MRTGGSVTCFSSVMTEPGVCLEGRHTQAKIPGMRLSGRRQRKSGISRSSRLSMISAMTSDPDDVRAYLWLCETSKVFPPPKMNGSTPEETAGTGWFKRKEISNLDLTGRFRDDWEKEIHLEDRLAEMKSLQRVSNEVGEWLILDDPDRMGAGMGSRWPYPQRAGQEEPWINAGPGAVPGNNAGDEPPGHHPENDIADHEEARIYPHGNETTYPRRRGRNRPASRFPDTDPGEGGKYPQGGNSDPGPGAVSIGSSASKEAPHPIVGSVPAKTPKPYSPRSVPPQTFDTSDVVQEEGPEGENVIAGKCD